MRKVISQTNRNGFFYTLDRTNGQFIQGKPFTTVNWTAGLDPKTGKPIGLRCQPRPFKITPAKRSATARRPSTCGPPIMGCRR